jgi:hypothetical protein
VRRPELVHCVAATVPVVVVVDDDESARSHADVEVAEHVRRRLVQVAVDAQNGEALDRR